MSKYNLGFRYVIQEIENFDLGTIIECENGNKYELMEAENKQRKFSRKDGTKLRFMTYDNIDKMFRIIEEKTIDIESIEETEIKNDGTKYFEYENQGATESGYSKNYSSCDVETRYKINELVQAVKQLNRKIKKG